MTLQEYQEKSRTTALYVSIQEAYVYPVLGLVSEAGEVAGKVKKVFRDDGGIMSLDTRESIQKELGDVLWYLSQVATELGMSLETIAVQNLARLQDRQARGVLGGSGDNR